MGRIRSRKPGLLAAAMVALAAGATLPAVTADAQRGHRGDRAGHHDSKRGTVCIGRDSHEFWFGGSPTHGILNAFRHCGYHAWISKGSIHVRYHGHRPRFSISAPGYSFGVSYGRGCVIITPKCLAPPPKNVRYRVRDSWGYDDHRPHRWHGSRGHFRGSWGHRRGWNVHWGWGYHPKHRGWHQPRRCR
jgi:hypothetical protein